MRGTWKFSIVVDAILKGIFYNNRGNLCGLLNECLVLRMLQFVNSQDIFQIFALKVISILHFITVLTVCQPFRKVIGKLQDAQDDF